MHHTSHAKKAEPGDNVGFNVRGLAANDIEEETSQDIQITSQCSYVTMRHSLARFNLWRFQRQSALDILLSSTRTPLR